ncbi:MULTISPECIES: hypothetical protein [Curtobacterium]|uniref:Uncharacterized protein n=3 Tax=Curtobacterium TaxID=2034 RepID=A0A9Q2W5V4_9MICO|nr:hypothetical protein [Curtobacterium flaccumfaciens]MBO9045022.1 hypothetical protein [Curtobacterium flaccumfaciens pv. flaccumfaciens]MBO9048836.1 hypothetical protein [Curtobacterium flaccumfaciens pv. flaccumfaciens]MBT1543027.1 hypothetical protein [Curtobacterium flaccumfaciens pv. flaccumfaciens]MBT1545799.1 hypothetical protein [Curtobacterium flaccumfaciens pv. flaccumfaciens]MBT1588973.1 hypothetical protein [Curtobacterium flaccumfaciens pv. flaccumfaciens]
MSRHRADRSRNAPMTAADRRQVRGVVRFVGGMGVLVFLIVVIFVAPAVLRSYDLDHRLTLRCHVTLVEGTTRGSSYRGIGGPNPRVVVTTDDCGKLILWEGVTERNYRAIASRIDAQGEYAIEVGAGTWKARGLLYAIRRSPSAFGVEPAS